MAFQISPGVLVQEKDLSNVVPAVATTIGGIVGDFQWKRFMRLHQLIRKIIL